MNACSRYGRMGDLGVGVGSALAVLLSSMPTLAAPPDRPRPGVTPRSPVPEMSGDEAGLGVNTCKKWKDGRRYTVTVPKEAELEQLVQWMMSISCQKFIWNGKIRSGKVTILSPEQITLREAYAAFYAALESMGLTVEPSGNYFKIVETSGAKSLNVPTYPDGQSVPNNDRFVTQLVRVNHVPATDVATVLKKITDKQGSVEAVGDLLIITDRGSTITRLLNIIDELDHAGTGEKIFFYQLKYADAEEIGRIVREIFGEGGKGKSKKSKSKSKSKASDTVGDLSFSRVIVDERTGTIIIVASESDYGTIRRLIEQLDVRLPGGGGRLHHYRLKYGDPEEIANVLSQLAQAGSRSSKKGKTKGNKSASQGGEAAELFSGEVKITADKATRSLIIMASAPDFKNLRPIIDGLDIQRRQVYIELYILEMTVTRGVTAGAGGHFGFAQPVGGGGTVPQGDALGLISSAPTPDVNSLVLSPEALSGFAGGLLGPLIPQSGRLLGLDQDIPSFGFILQALASHNDVNLVSEPHFPTADNQEANMVVGKRVPTPGALSFGGPGGGGSAFQPLQSITREDVTLDIKVTPHVNDEKSLTMDVEIEDKDIAERDPTLGVSTTQRKIKLEDILAYDDQPLVLGGLIREREVMSTKQVPGIGSIPILGWLFKRKERSKEKVNLLIVMVPHILDSPDDIRRIKAQRTGERLEFMERETRFKRHDIDADVNYRRKKGLLSSIDRDARAQEQQERLYRAAQAELNRESVTGEIGLSPRPADEAGGDDDVRRSTASPGSSSKRSVTPEP
ncbi:MAG: type II secretion system protein GspD [Myxococcales bacterium FL481]|nr:MAG: type II secretion system protein GspD [Myxococcales bacterium FL481]